jgi:hypothetical protein
VEETGILDVFLICTCAKMDQGVMTQNEKKIEESMPHLL